MNRDHLKQFHSVASRLVSLGVNYAPHLGQILDENPGLISPQWFHVSSVINKNEIRDTLNGVLNAMRLTYADLNLMLLPFQASPLPLWKQLWDYVIFSGSPRMIRERQLWGQFQQGLLSRVYKSLVAEILDRLSPRLLSGTLERRRRTILFHIENYFHSLTVCGLLYDFIKENEDSVSGKLKSILPLLEMPLNGSGMLYVISREDGTVIELRLPVWRVRDVPDKIIDDIVAQMPLMQIMVLRDDVYVPECVWRSPQKITVQDILNERSARVRRAMLDVIGNEGLLKTAGVSIIDNQERLTLYRIEMRLPYGNEAMHIVRCVCPSTGKEHLLRVPPGITDARAAVAWTFGETKDAYKPEIET